VNRKDNKWTRESRSTLEIEMIQFECLSESHRDCFYGLIIVTRIVNISRALVSPTETVSMASV